MNRKKTLISVVIPAFNEEKYLPRLLNSLKVQNYKNFEIIVVDNNSEDNTAKVARDFGVKVVKEKRQGMIPAREKGFAEARGEIIVRTDADSIVPPNWLEKIVAIFRSYPDVIAITGSFTSEYRFLPSFFINIYTLLFVIIGRLLTGHIHLHGPNMAVKRDAWKKINIHKDDSLVHEDIDLACHLAEIGEIRFFPHITTTYSLRRLRRSPLYTIIEYSIRYIRTVFIHHPFFRRHKRK